MTKKSFLILLTGVLLISGLFIYHRVVTRHPFPITTTSTTIIPSNKLVKSITTLVNTNGGRVDWSQENNLIAFSKLGQNNYAGEIYTMHDDGSNQVCITCAKSQIAHLSNDQPAWTADGKYILFQSIDPSLSLPDQLQSQAKQITQGGSGFNNNLWVVTPDGTKFYQLTHIQSREATLHAHFSSDGKKLLYSYRKVNSEGRQGQWMLRVADFIDDASGPHLENPHDYQPLGSNVFYESHDITPDGQSIIFSANMNNGSPTNCECALGIWEMNLATQQANQLTNTTDVWNEHSLISSDGKKIDWISSQGYPFTPSGNWQQSLKTDLWLMNADGSNKQQLTFFNTPGHPEYVGDRIILADSSWNKDGTALVFTTSDVSGIGVAVKIMKLTFTSPQ